VVYKFGEFELDASQYRLSRGGAAIAVKPAVLELLVYLVERRERVVGKHELFTKLWDGRFVTDGVLAEAVYEARRALGDDGDRAGFVRTVRGRGYQFHYRPVEEIVPQADSAAAMRAGYLVWSGGPTPLRAGENGIGRDPASIVVLDSPRVSRHHARIVVTEDRVVLEDLGSKNGTRLNRQPLEESTVLSDGDVIELGGIAMIYRSGVAGLSTTSV
jgi:DNA-binding winged helix-turn-helix (wHTH) protein